MELYRIVATCSNNSQSITLDWLPENFEGVKITQKFNFSNPMGYTPTYSLETMKVIKSDKTWCDNIFQTYGLQSIVLFEIFKLNTSATGYTSQASFKIDFESYNKQDFYSEFALKANSCIDKYNDTKNTARNFTGAGLISLPSRNYINYFSLKKLDGIVSAPVDNKAYLVFEENEGSRVYNSDTAMFYEPYLYVYEFNRTGGTTDFLISAQGRIFIDFTYGGGTKTIYLKLYKSTNLAESVDFSNPILTIDQVNVVASSTILLNVDFPKTKVSDYSFSDGDVFFIGIESSDPAMQITEIRGDLSVDIYMNTESPANPFERQINYLTAGEIIDDIFDGQANVDFEITGLGVTSAQTIIKRINTISLIPKDFIVDFCLATGSVVNFKNDGSVKFDTINAYFADLLKVANAVEVTNFKNVQFSYDNSLNFASVSVGMDQRDYEVYTYSNDWHKILTFSQIGRVASENLDLSLTKFRVDFSGILDYVNKTSKSATEKATDMFIFNPLFTSRASNEGAIYDWFTPRDILENWRKFLVFCFCNYGLTTLELASNSGDDFNLQIFGVNQFDDFVLTTSDPIITPLRIELTCLLDEIDFSEKILKITHNGEDIYIFVVEAETTDKLNEQKIKGNVINFPT